MGKRIKKISGSHLLISSLQGLALKTLVEASRCHQAFLKPCLVNLISKDIHLVFSIYLHDSFISSFDFMSYLFAFLVVP